MVLYSLVDGFPLAAIHLECSNWEYENVPAIFTKRPQSSDMPCHFQGLIGEDNQEFKIVISNLMSDSMIKIDILTEDRKVMEVDPGVEGKGVNQVNELHENQSYAIPCDQKDNLAFILRMLQDSSGNTISIRQDERNAAVTSDKPKGTYYWISVVPPAGKPDVSARFARTVWSCPDVIYRKCKMTHYRYRGGIEEGSIQEVLYDYDPSDINGSGYWGELQCASASANRREVVCETAYTALHRGTLEEAARSYTPVRGVAKGAIESPVAARGGGVRGGVRGGVSVTDENVMDSKASQIVGGRHINVYSGFTGVGYDYDNHSVKCCIGLSVMPGLVLENTPSTQELVEIASQQIEMAMADANAAFIEDLNRVYLAEECCVCMESEPNMVLYKCGHQCLHRECGASLIRCPLCRSTITAKIDVKW